MAPRVRKTVTPPSDPPEPDQAYRATAQQARPDRVRIRCRARAPAMQPIFYKLHSLTIDKPPASGRFLAVCSTFFRLFYIAA